MRRAKPNPSDVLILALDQSTDVTGVCLVHFVKGAPLPLSWGAFDATHDTPNVAKSRTDLAARFARIGYTADRLEAFVSLLPQVPQVIAAELDTNRGHSASSALHMATGAYLAIPSLRSIPPYLVTRQAACIACSSEVFKVYREPAGKTEAQRSAKRSRLKAAVIDWAGSTFPSIDLPTDYARKEAIADALSVAMAAYKQIAG